MSGSSRLSCYYKQTKASKSGWSNKDPPHTSSSSRMRALSLYKNCKSSANSCSSSYRRLFSSGRAWSNKSLFWKKSCKAWSMRVNACSSIWRMQKNELKSHRKTIKLSLTHLSKQHSSRNKRWIKVKVRSSRSKSSISSWKEIYKSQQRLLKSKTSSECKLRSHSRRQRKDVASGSRSVRVRQRSLTLWN